MPRHLLASTSDGNDYVHCAINKPGDPSASYPPVKPRGPIPTTKPEARPTRSRRACARAVRSHRDLSRHVLRNRQGAARPRWHIGQRVTPELVAKTAIYCRESGRMKDMPAFLVAHLAAHDLATMTRVFPRVIDDGRMLRNFVQIVRSGVTAASRSARHRSARSYLVREPLARRHLPPVDRPVDVHVGRHQDGSPSPAERQGRSRCRP
jgi:hypothetical protein